MAYAEPYATAYISPRQMLPGLTYLPSTHAVLEKDNQHVELGNIIHFDTFNGSIENHIKTLLP